MTEINRRQTLYLTGMGMTALAGCSTSSDESDGTADDPTNQTPDDGADEPADPGETTEYEGTIEAGALPSYASLLPDLGRSEYFYGAIDIETMVTLLEEKDVQSGENPTDPLVVNPVVIALLCFDGLTRLRDSPAANAYSTHDETPAGESTLVYANGIYAIDGEYDRDGLEATLEEDGYATQVADDGYTIYAHEETGGVVGVTDAVFAFPNPNAGGSEFDPTAAVRRTLETAVGRREPKHATDDEFEWLLRAGHNGGITTGIYTDAGEFDATWLGTDQSDDGTDTLESEYGPFEGANGAHQHLALADDNGARAGAIVTYAAEDRVNVDRLESSLGTEADTVDVVRDGPAASINAKYDGDL